MPTLHWIHKQIGGDVLTGPVFDVLAKFVGSKVIYAAARKGIAFKQIHCALEV